MTEPPAPPPAAPPVAHHRLFVGARLSVATTNALAAVVETLARRTRDARIDVRWVAVVDYHVTLKFLGWTQVPAVGAVRDALERAVEGVGPLTVQVRRIGAFPSLDRASVIWAGVEDASGGLRELAGRVERAMVDLGFAAEVREFHPHVTLGRARETRLLKEVVLPVAEQMFGESKLDAISLFESETKSGGSSYSESSRIEFKEAVSGVDPDAERQTRAVELDPRDDTDDGWPRGQGPSQ